MPVQPETEEANSNTGPQIEQSNWDSVAGDEVEADETFENGDFRYEEDGESSEEDDDNPFQESDEALPEDGEEDAIADSNARSGAGMEMR